MHVVVLQQHAPIVGEAREIGVKQLLQGCKEFVAVGVALERLKVAKGHEFGRLRVEAQRIADSMGELIGGALVILLVCLLNRAAHGAPGLAMEVALELVERLLYVKVCIPHIERPHLREALHRRAILLCAGAHGIAAVVLGEVAVASADLDARSKAFDVPFPRAGCGFVEVVDIEHEMARGAREDAEVRDVRVADALHLDAADRLRGEVVCRDDGCAAEERERRGGHALVAERHELGYAGGGLSIYKLDGVCSVGLDAPNCEIFE